jgi:biotin transport system substrate-specific component
MSNALATAVRFPTLIDLLRPTDAGRARAFDVLAVLVASLLVAAAAQISVQTPWGIPFTASDIAALLVGVALGPWRGAAALTLYMIQGLAGLPVFAGGHAGFPPITFGYILGFIAAACIAGALAQRGWDRSRLRLAAALTVSQIAIYAGGLSWMAIVSMLKIEGAPALTFDNILWAGCIVFLPAAAVKIALAVALIPAAWRTVGRTR